MSRKAIPIEPYLPKLEQALILGATYALAAAHAGISVRTFARWRSQAKQAQPGTALARLRDRLHLAEARAAINWLTQIEQAATNGDWRAAAYKLEHRYPDQYGSRVKAQLRLDIERIAQEVAADIGINPALILKEAQALLATHDAQHPR
jgi:hypothetical protein